jgi:hypothetical protein
MKRTAAALTALCTAVVALAAAGARADEKQAFLGIFAETASMKMAGMPAMPKIELPPGVKLPPQALNAMKMLQPHRALTVRLWSPGIAPDNATASLAIPDGLKLGPKLDLELYRPKPSEGEGADVGGPGNPVNPEMTIKRYWGSSATVKPGQPDVIEFKGLTPEQKALMRANAAKMRRSNSYFYKPDWTTAYWPTEKQPGAVEDDAALTGHYALSTTYTGNVELDVPSNVNFLAPIEMSSPKLEKVVDLGDAIVFRWSGIPNALGLHANIFGMNQDTKTITMWSSSEVKPDMGLSYDYLQMAEVRDLVGKNILMAGDRVDVTVPAGIFKDCDMVMFQMIGYGPGAAIDKGQPLPRVQTKTTLNIMLGGKKMPRPGRGGFPGGDGGGLR